MAKVCFLRINSGDFNRGFHVTLRIRGESEPLEEPDLTQVVTDGRLSPAPELLRKYQDWQKKFKCLDATFRGITVKRVSGISLDQFRQDCNQASTNLIRSFRDWLKSSEFRSVEDELRTHLQPGDEIQFLIQTDSDELRKMPWDTWEFMRRYRKAAIGITPLRYKRLQQYKVGEKLRILAILGSTRGVINLNEDQKVLKSLPGAEVHFIVEPKREQLAKLWEETWDVLFFAGHSSSQGENGYFDINKHDKLQIIELENTLIEAVEKGLKLAIFNSCDGLGLARQLENLHIPQVIVWREPVPDRVAHTFLKAFMQEFSQGNSLYMSVRRAKSKLHETSDGEKMFPGVSFLPVIIQNPLVETLSWPSNLPSELITETGLETSPSVIVKVVEAPKNRQKLLALTGMAIAAIFFLLAVQFLPRNSPVPSSNIAEEEAKKEYKEYDKKLNELALSVSTSRSAKGGVFLSTAQQTWEDFREEYCRVDFSRGESQTKQPELKYYSCLIEITKQRIKDLTLYQVAKTSPPVGKEYKKVDMELENTYDKLRKKLPPNKEEQLVNSQNYWKRFQWQGCNYEGIRWGKSGLNKCRIRTTEQRTRDLKRQLK